MDNEDFIRQVMQKVRRQSNERARNAGAMSMGDLCTALGTMPPGAPIVIDGAYGDRTPTSLYSYRGYYERLSLGWGADEHEETRLVGGGEPNWYEPGTLSGASELQIKSPAAVGDMLDALNTANGAEFEGYKGGQFEMNWGTWIHVADYGSTGPAVVGVKMRDDGTAVILTAEID